MTIIIGELINGTRKKVKEALDAKDVDFFRDLALKQVDAGADVIDVNVGGSKDEPVAMDWLVGIIQNEIDRPLCIDTTSSAVLEAGLKACNDPPWINSISGEGKRLQGFLPLMKKYNFANVIALASDDKGPTDSAIQRVTICDNVLKILKKENIDSCKVFFDPLIFPISNDKNSGKIFTEALHLLGVGNLQTVAAISNISFGLPQRSVLNRALASMAVKGNVDAVIINPLDFELMASVKAADLVIGNDHRCRKYTKFIKKHKNH